MEIEYRPQRNTEAHIAQQTQRGSIFNRIGSQSPK